MKIGIDMGACRMPDLGYIEFNMHRMQHGLFVLYCVVVSYSFFNCNWLRDFFICDSICFIVWD